MSLRELIAKTHAEGVAIKQKLRHWAGVEKTLEEQNAARRRHLWEKEHAANFTMYDAVEVAQIPAEPAAVAGYVGGKWPTFKELVKRFPNAKHLSIAIEAAEDADCLDVETGAATPEEVPAWVQHQKSRGVKKPAIYASLDTMFAVRVNLARAKIPRSEVRLWVAHYTNVAHIPFDYDACQWTQNAGGKNLDQSLCLGSFL